MKKKVWRWVFVIYILLLLVSWTVEQDHLPQPLPGGNWQEVLIEVPVQDAVAEVPLRYRKYVGTDLSKVPVLLIHGSPLASSSFDPLLENLPSQYTYLLSDLPGFGYSRYGFTDYSFESHADALIQLIQSEGWAQVHLVAYSQGGGPALKLLSAAPEKVASLTLLSSIGVLEHELTGDYFLNQLLYGGQLIILRVLDWGVPHFGLLDKCLLNTRYAENFYYSDMRPLRSIMETVEAPALILHSLSDRLVPKSAAIEHMRILPQSRICWGEGGHSMLMSQPEWVSQQLFDFFSSVDDGSASTRSQSSPDRLLAAGRQLQDSDHMPSIAVLCLTLLALILGTFLSEDLTCITAGLLSARGFIPLSFAMPACFLGILIGDMLLYAVGRFGGRRLLSRWPFRHLITPTAIESAKGWLDQKGAVVVLISRFMPGTRLPFYLTAGLVRVNAWKMAFWLTLAGLLWAFPMVALVAYLGQSFSDWLVENGKFMLLGILMFCVVAFLFMRLAVVLLSYEGRRKVYARFQRVKQWEFWPPTVFYTPVFFVLLWTFLRKGKFLASLSCNPEMPPMSGLMGEKKNLILDNLSVSGCVPKHLLISDTTAAKVRLAKEWMVAENMTFPLVLKPNQGERGRGVRILKTSSELEEALHQCKCDVLLQEYVSGFEFGIFYIRSPEDASGSVVSIGRKIMTSVTGDGQSTLKALILNDARAYLSYRYFFRSFQERLLEVPAMSESVQLAQIGTHARGSLFLNGADLITPELEAEIDRIAKCFKGFYLGRFDLRCPSEADLKRGVGLRIIELNGVTAEPVHIYHPQTPLRIGLKAVIRQWKTAHEIGLINISKGAPVTSFSELLKHLMKRRYHV